MRFAQCARHLPKYKKAAENMSGRNTDSLEKNDEDKLFEELLPKEELSSD